MALFEINTKGRIGKSGVQASKYNDQESMFSLSCYHSTIKDDNGEVKKHIYANIIVVVSNEQIKYKLDKLIPGATILLRGKLNWSEKLQNGAVTTTFTVRYPNVVEPDEPVKLFESQGQDNNNNYFKNNDFSKSHSFNNDDDFSHISSDGIPF